MTSVYLRGLADYNGETLAVFLAGLDCGDFPVVHSRIAVPFGSAGGLLTERWLTQVSAMGRDWGSKAVSLEDGRWIVPVVVGYRYASRGQLLRPVSDADTGTRQGPAFGKLKRISNIVALVKATKGIKFGTSFDRMNALNAMTPGERRMTAGELFDGIYLQPLADDSGFDNMVAWEVTGPYSAQINAIGGFIKTEE